MACQYNKYKQGIKGIIQLIKTQTAHDEKLAGETVCMFNVKHVTLLADILYRTFIKIYVDCRKGYLLSATLKCPLLSLCDWFALWYGHPCVHAHTNILSHNCNDYLYNWFADQPTSLPIHRKMR